MTEVRPSAEGVLRLRVLTVIVVVGSVLQELLKGQGLSAGTLVTGAIALVICFAWIEAWRRGSVIRTDGPNGVRRWRLGIPLRERTVSSGVYLPTIVNGFGVTVPRIALFDLSGRAVLRIGGEFWDSAAIEQLAETFAAIMTVDRELLPAKAAIQRMPSAFAFRERRPYLNAALIVGGFMVFCGAIVAIAVATS